MVNVREMVVKQVVKVAVPVCSEPDTKLCTRHVLALCPVGSWRRQWNDAVCLITHLQTPTQPVPQA